MQGQRLNAALIFVCDFRTEVTTEFSADRLFIVSGGAGTAGRTFDPSPQLPNINLQFSDGPAERVAMHPQLTRGPALVSVIFLQHCEDEPLLEFAYRLGIQNIAFVHLQDECFELISHGASLFLLESCIEKLPRALFSNCKNSVLTPQRAASTCVAVHGAAGRVLDKSATAIPAAPPKWRRALLPGNTAPIPILPATPTSARTLPCSSGPLLQSNILAAAPAPHPK